MVREPLAWLVPLAAATLVPAVASALYAGGVVTAAMALHAAAMLTAWGLLMPAGGVLARYYKVLPGQDFPRVHNNLFWWRWHQRLQYGGMALGTGALILILSKTDGRVGTLHGRVGLIVMSIGGLQVASGWLRGSRGGPTGERADPFNPATWRGDHYDMTARRRVFERWHKPAGWAALALAAVTVLLGAALVGAPGWLLALAGLLQGGLAVGLLDGALRKRWVDTHAALWGTDTELPGDHRRAASRPPARAEVSLPAGTEPAGRG